MVSARSGESKVFLTGCPYKSICSFYSDLTKKLGMVIYFKGHFCEGRGYEKCARYIAYSNNMDVPDDLYPSQRWPGRNMDRTDQNAQNQPENQNHLE